MRHVGRPHWLLIVLVCVLIPLAPVRGAPAQTTVTVGIDQEVVGLDPHLVTAFSSFRRIDLLYNKLVRYNDQLDIEGDLAESWENPDSRTYVFTLRKGVRFHSGAELTSEDVRFSLERVLDPATRSPGRSFIDVIDKIDVIDRYTIRLKLKHQLASILSGLASGNLAIVEKAAVQKNGNLQKVEAGTGPFTLAEWVPDNFMRLSKHPGYFRRGLPRVDQVVFRVIPDQASLLAGVRSRSLDMATINWDTSCRGAARASKTSDYDGRCRMRFENGPALQPWL